MLQQARMSGGPEKFDPLIPDFKDKQNMSRIRSDVNRLVVARYIILFMGAAWLLSVGVQALFLDGGVAYSRVFKIALVAIIGPGLIWAASDKEVRLLLLLDKNNSRLNQKVKENKALNRMTQDHLADCLSDHMDRQPQSHTQAQSQARNQLQPGASAIFTEAEPAPLRSDLRNVVVLDPEDNNFDRRYFQAAATGHR